MTQEKRNKGIYYTPPSIAHYLIQKSLLYYLRKNTNITSLKQLVESYKRHINHLKQRVQKLKLLDPACGDGIFVKNAIKELIKLQFLIYKYKERELMGSNYKDSILKLKENIISSNIYGVDNNKEVIETLRSTLEADLNEGNKEESLLNLSKSIIFGNSIVNDKSFSEESFSWEQTFESVMEGGGFDIIVGNPPWGADIQDFIPYFQEHYPTIAKGQFDSFSIFLYVALKKLLKKNGVLGFIIPNELLLLEQYGTLRKYLLKYQICELINLGFNIFPEHVQKPALLLIIKKCKLHGPQHLTNGRVLIRVGISDEEKENILEKNTPLEKIIINGSYFREQRDFRGNRGYIFDIFATSIDREIKQIIQANEFNPLKAYFVNGRGMDTNKQGRHIICPDCGYLNPPFGRGHSCRKMQKKCNNPSCSFTFFQEKKESYDTEDLILEESHNPGDHNAPGYIGEDLHRFYFERPPRLVKYYGDCYEDAKYSTYSLVGWKRPSLYEGDKILVRKVSSGYLPQVMATKEYIITNQQIYIFKKQDIVKDVSIYFYLALLTSRLIHYYCLKEFGDPDKDVMPHFTQSHIKQLPIPKPNPEERRYEDSVRITKAILKMVEKYRPQNDEKSQQFNKIQSLFSELDDIVFQYYNIQEPRHKERIVEVANQNGFQVF